MSPLPGLKAPVFRPLSHGFSVGHTLTPLLGLKALVYVPLSHSRVMGHNLAPLPWLTEISKNPPGFRKTRRAFQPRKGHNLVAHGDNRADRVKLEIEPRQGRQKTAN